jgi:hypothetical protein
MNLAGREPRAADQLVNIDGAWAERADDQLALACADVGEGLRRAFLVGGGKLDGGGGWDGRPKIGARASIMSRALVMRQAPCFRRLLVPAERGSSGLPGTAKTSRPCSPARRAVIKEPERSAAF